MQTRLRLLMLFMMAIPAAASAQKKKKDANPEPQKALQKKIGDYVMADFRATAQSHLLVEIDEMKKICKLSDSAVKKLKVAAKGAAGKFVASYDANIRRRLFRRPIPKGVEIRVGSKVVRKGPQKLLNLFGQDYYHVSIKLGSYGVQISERTRNSSHGQGVGGRGLSQLHGQPIWKKTLDREVSAEQQALFKGALKQRRDRVLAAAIAFQIARLDSQLKLSDEQRKKLAALFSTGLNLSRNNIDTIEWRLRSRVNELDVKKVGKFLSAAQLQIWHSLRQR